MEMSYKWGSFLSKEGPLVINTLNKENSVNYNIIESSSPYIPLFTNTSSKNIFEDDFFNSIYGNDIWDIHPALAFQVAGMIYTCGKVESIKCFQRTLNSLNDDIFLLEDGMVKDRDLMRLKDIVQNRMGEAAALLFPCFRVHYYATLEDNVWGTYGPKLVRHTFETLVLCRLSISEEAQNIINSIIECLKNQKTHFEIKKNVLHYLELLIKLVKKQNGL